MTHQWLRVDICPHLLTDHFDDPSVYWGVDICPHLRGSKLV